MSAMDLLQAQQRIWYVEETFPGSPMYNIGGAVLFETSMDMAVLEQAIMNVIANHDGIRLQLRFADGKVSQHVTDAVPARLERVDFRQEANPEAALDDWLDREGAAPFVLYDGPLYCFHLVAVTDRISGYCLKFHHVIADGWSMKIVTEDIMAAYDKLLYSTTEEEEPVAPSYVRAVEEERRYLSSERCNKSKAYWMQKFDDIADLPLPASLSSYKARRKTFWLSSVATQRIRAWVQQSGFSANTLFCTLSAIYLSRWLGRKDVIVGVPVLNRSGKTERSIFGMFASLLPLRVRVERGMTVNELAVDMARELKHVFMHQKYPYNYLIRDVGMHRRQHEQLFELCVNYSNASLLHSYEGKPVRNQDFFPGYQTYGLHLLIKDWGEADSIRLDLEYTVDRYDETEIEALAERLQRLVEAMCLRPNEAVSALPWLSDTEQDWLVKGGSDNELRWDIRGRAHRWLEEQARLRPTAPALRYRHIRMSYDEVNRRANRVAWKLRRDNVASGEVVGVCMERSADTVIAIFGIWKAGAAYMPIDPSYPLERMRFMMSKCGVSRIVANRSSRAVVQNVCVHPIWLHEEDMFAGVPEHDLPDSTTDTTPAYVIFTSGSTGQPKGVWIEHRALANRILWMQRRFPLGPGDVVLHKTPITFDVSVWEIVWWCVGGAELSVLPHGEEKDPVAIAERIRSDRVTVLHFVPSMLHAFLLAQETGMVPQEAVSKVKCVFASGEALTYEAVQRFYAAWGRDNAAIELHNLYGPTEAAIDVTAFHCPRDWERKAVPIGKPIDNIRLYVVDAVLELVPKGAIGELCIAGVGLARGYIGDPALTGQKFVTLPVTGERVYRTGDAVRWDTDGNLQFIGRIDQQVKIRGYRIEPGEIEQALLKHEDVREAAVVARGGQGADLRLYAYVGTSASLQEEALREHVKGILPSYMVPARIVIMRTLPVTAHGKVDRKALPEPAAAGVLSEAVEKPSTPQDQLIMEVVRAVLGDEQIGWVDDFFLSGGDSIKAIQIAARLHERGVVLRASDLLEHPVIRDAASFAKEAAVLAGSQSWTGPLEQTPIVAWFWSKGYAQPHHWNQSVVLKLLQTRTPAEIEQALREVLQSSDVCRLGVGEDHRLFYVADGLLPAFRLEVWDAAHVPDSERERWLERRAAAWKSGFALQSGMLVKGALLLWPGREERLLLTAHHLVIDGVSWRTIIDRLDRRLAGEWEDRGAWSVSYGQWAHALHQGAAAAQSELAYWLQETIPPHTSVLPDKGNSDPVPYGECVSLSSVFSLAATDAYIGPSNDAFRTKPLELLLASFALATADLFGGDSLPLMLESHGREYEHVPLAAAGTIGWFTSIYPVTVPLVPESVSDQILAVKDRLRRIPHNGIGYGLLVYSLRAMSPVAEHDRIRFNFLGELEGGLEVRTVSITDERYGADIGSQNELGCLLDVNAYVYQGQLRVRIQYSPAQFRTETIERLLEQWEQQLDRLNRSCAEKTAVLSVQDFEWSGLTQEELDGLFDA